MFICLFIRNSCDHISTKRIAAPKMILVYNNSKYLRVFQLKKNLEIMVHQPQLSSSYYTWMTQQTNIYLVNLFKSISEKRPVTRRKPCINKSVFKNSSSTSSKQNHHGLSTSLRIPRYTVCILKICCLLDQPKSSKLRRITLHQLQD